MKINDDFKVETVSKRLKTAREQAGITQERLAEKVGCSQSLIGNLESGNQKSSVRLPAIAQALGVDAIWLAEGKVKTTSFLNRLHEAYEESGIKSYAELARRAGLKSHSTISDLMRGRTQESPQLPKICMALGVDIIWLQTGVNQLQKNKNEMGRSPLVQSPDTTISRIVKMLESTDQVGRGVALHAVMVALKEYEAK